MAGEDPHEMTKDEKAAEATLAELSRRFPTLRWDFRPDPVGGRTELISQWLGDPEEEVMLCAFTGDHIDERFHRQDFFFINFAYHGTYEALSARYSNRVTLEEGDCYIGQPYSGYAMKKSGPDPVSIVGILIQKEAFLREYLAPISEDPVLLRFFLEPMKNRYADEFIKLSLPRCSPIWNLLRIMMTEYVGGNLCSQKILKSLTLTILLYIIRSYHEEQEKAVKPTLTESLLQYIALHSDSLTLQSMADHFGYHPVYLSRLLVKLTEKTFSELLLDSRMRKAKLFLENTPLSNEKIAELLGYKNASNFYRAYKSYYGTTPRVTKAA